MSCKKHLLLCHFWLGQNTVNNLACYHQTLGCYGILHRLHFDTECSESLWQEASCCKFTLPEIEWFLFLFNSSRIEVCWRRIDWKHCEMDKQFRAQQAQPYQSSSLGLWRMGSWRSVQYNSYCQVYFSELLSVGRFFHKVAIVNFLVCTRRFLP